MIKIVCDYCNYYIKDSVSAALSISLISPHGKIKAPEFEYFEHVCQTCINDIYKSVNDLKQIKQARDKSI
jgi:hypothetical protein